MRRWAVSRGNQKHTGNGVAILLACGPGKKQIRFVVSNVRRCRSVDSRPRAEKIGRDGGRTGWTRGTMTARRAERGEHNDSG
jgi:hypothetical protein